MTIGLLTHSLTKELNEIERKKNVVDSSAGTGKGKSTSDLNREKVAQLTKQISEEAKKLSAARAALSKAKPADGKAPAKGATVKGKGGKSDDVTMEVSSSASPEQPAEKKERKKRAAPAAMDVDGEKKGLLKPVPEAAVTILANLLVQHATLGVAKIVAKFLEEYPDVSKRQTELKISEMADKEKRGYVIIAVYSLTHLLTHSLTHLLTHSLTYSLTHLLTHLLTHSLSI